VTCDGQSDTVVFGSEKSKVVVAVVPSGQSNKMQVFWFPIARDKQNGFCALPTGIRTAPLNCDTEGGPREGCKPAKGCQEFAVGDDGCHPYKRFLTGKNSVVEGVDWRKSRWHSNQNGPEPQRINGVIISSLTQ
jgi:hypothetical protein